MDLKLIKENKQMAERRVVRDDGALEITEIKSGIRKYGKYTGYPSIFIKMAGCSISCERSNVDYTTGRRLESLDSLINQVRKLTIDEYRPLVVLSGGEPFRQACGRFVGCLKMEGYRVEIEINGTLWDDTIHYWVDSSIPSVSLVCTPQTPKINNDVEKYISAYRYIMREGQVDAEDGLPTISLKLGSRPYRKNPLRNVPVYIQPMIEDEADRNVMNKEACIESCMKFGYFMCL